MVMKTLQVGRRGSSLPSNMKLFTLALTAIWISKTCWATTDSTCITGLLVLLAPLTSASVSLVVYTTTRMNSIVRHH